MTIRRLLIGTTLVFGLCVWARARSGEPHPAAPTAPVYAVENAADVHPGGTHDEAVARFRSGQATHWRQVVIGRK
jgi:hypothetical protein